ncbi:putative alkylmercury lyase [Desulfurella amilsii]|uniref:Putative alkylmercury lyase n=1 Tax=Desulfurella amilsii TaxID=1562698 RepID=A0A1X4XXB6_9BACT|nr:hypothetical protein [Desulfurella amilsii]OSS42164.1 putative alkylmercury lyase [Desulfurella amilsii]
MKKTEFLYFSGCPNFEPTFSNLLEALKELGTNINVQNIDVETLGKAKEVNFLGSPFIYRRY